MRRERMLVRGSAPHIVIVIADDFGIDVFGPYGDADGDGLPDDGRRYPRTENLTALCQAGMRFESAWSAPCSPTRAAILTGRYGFRTGIGAALPRGEGISVGRAHSSSDSGRIRLADGEYWQMAFGHDR